MPRYEKGKCELTNIVAVIDKEKNAVLVQNRVRGWSGYAFPGGHIEPGESFYESAVREIREETGLEISNLRFCGISHWYNKQTCDRFMVFCYTASDFKGELVSSEEGSVFWMDIEEFRRSGKLSYYLHEQLDLFFTDRFCEVYLEYDGDDPPIMNIF
ncbi:MAG: 8-oxo-dGTP diphosphatase [Clostridia bacterium]|nr:8-oxo-dGTP diphosphatase [Clostridia bacterium]